MESDLPPVEPSRTNQLTEFEAALARVGDEHYTLRLYVTGMSRLSTEAVANIRRVCETHLEGRYQLEVIDLYKQPEMAQREQILAAPTLIKSLPLPIRRMVGNLANNERVMLGLNIHE